MLRQFLQWLITLSSKSASQANASEPSTSRSSKRSPAQLSEQPLSGSNQSDIAEATSTASSTSIDLQKEIRAQRKFSVAEAIGREGGTFMKGESTIPRPVRAANATKQFIITHIDEPAGALSTTLQDWAASDIRLSRNLDTPLIALSQILQSLLSQPTLFYEFARQVAIAQAQLTGDRPHFQQPDKPPHPDAHYTHETIRAELSALLQQL